MKTQIQGNFNEVKTIYRRALPFKIWVISKALPFQLETKIRKEKQTPYKLIFFGINILNISTLLSSSQTCKSSIEQFKIF